MKFSSIILNVFIVICMELFKLKQGFKLYFLFKCCAVFFLRSLTKQTMWKTLLRVVHLHIKCKLNVLRYIQQHKTTAVTESNPKYEFLLLFIPFEVYNFSSFCVLRIKDGIGKFLILYFRYNNRWL